ncbi:hypothetical protein GCM10009827_083850 [Dactylosporangium maewongense]|uniref:Uncharacterized protein n=1 Tax=Dactylosporangium maewongense TaxID=634393 RepID=A0ABN2C0B6_9ACTN
MTATIDETRWTRKPVPAPPTVDEATQALAAAEAKLAAWTADAADREHAAEVAAAELAEAEAVAGDEAFETPTNLAELGEDLIRRRTHLEVSHRAVTAARARVADAQRGLLLARAEDARARARQLRDIASVRAARTAALLDELNGFERTTYTVAPWSPMVGGAPGAPMPLTQQTRNRADWLDGQADELDRFAEDGSAEQVAAAVARPAVPADAVEADAFGASTTSS